MLENWGGYGVMVRRCVSANEAAAVPQRCSEADDL